MFSYIPLSKSSCKISDAHKVLDKISIGKTLPIFLNLHYSHDIFVDEFVTLTVSSSYGFLLSYTGIKFFSLDFETHVFWNLGSSLWLYFSLCAIYWNAKKQKYLSLKQTGYRLLIDIFAARVQHSIVINW